MNQLYPIKFNPIFKEKIWGGNKLESLLQKQISDKNMFGESWEISSVQDSVSVVSNGFLEGNSLHEIIEIYMGELVGDPVFDKFGVEFPLLIKFIDANADLSIQVHPNDKIAKERHKAYGKTEMWYVLQADEGGKLVSGFKSKTDKLTYVECVKSKSVIDILNIEDVKSGDVFLIPAGKIHSIGKGVLLAEIQQTSDITYRICDFDRVDNQGNKRDLHHDLAVDVIDYKDDISGKIDYKIKDNDAVNLVSSEYFKTNILQFNQAIEKDYTLLESFIIYICIEGSFAIECGGKKKTIMQKGEVVLLPASLEIVELIPDETTKVLEVYVEL